MKELKDFYMIDPISRASLVSKAQGGSAWLEVMTRDVHLHSHQLLSSCAPFFLFFFFLRLWPSVSRRHRTQFPTKTFRQLKSQRFCYFWKRLNYLLVFTALLWKCAGVEPVCGGPKVDDNDA